VDSSYFHKLSKTQVVSVHATWIHEDQDLKATAQIDGANARDRLDTARVDLSWSYKDTWTPTAQLFRTTGTSDPGQYSGPGGSPNSQGYVLELAYVGGGKPTSAVQWANWRAAVQYVGYEQFDGARRGASANNAVYVNLWLALAPLGYRVAR
jgi:hypothetical protein